MNLTGVIHIVVGLTERKHSLAWMLTLFLRMGRTLNTTFLWCACFETSKHSYGAWVDVRSTGTINMVIIQMVRVWPVSMGQASDMKKGLHKLITCKTLKYPCDYLITVSTFATCVAFYPMRLCESDRTYLMLLLACDTRFLTPIHFLATKKKKYLCWELLINSNSYSFVSNICGWWVTVC